MIFITDAEMRQALSCIRSLGRKGLQVYAGDSIGISPGLYSKYCQRRFHYPDPEKDEDSFIEWVIKFAKKYRPELIIPIRDKTLLPILKHRKQLERYSTIVGPKYDTAMLAREKNLTIEYASRIGLNVPETQIVKNLSDVQKCAFPVVIKRIQNMSFS